MFEATRTPEGALCGCPFGNMALEMSNHDDEIRGRLDEIYRAWARHLEGALEEAVARGDLPPIDAAAAAGSVVTFMSGAALIAKMRNSMEGSERLYRAIFALIHPELPARMEAAPPPADLPRAAWR